MKSAVIEVSSVAFEFASVLVDAGLRIAGSLDCGLADDGKFDCIRLLVEEDDFGRVLPVECKCGPERPGFPVVMITFVQESYGRQRLAKVQHAEVIGHLVRADDGKRRFALLTRREPTSIDYEQEAAKARTAAILSRVTEGA